MKKKVLITGANGFVGYHLVETALQANFEVHAAVRTSSNLEHLRSFDLSYISLDYNNIDVMRKELEKNQYEYIIHAAGITKAKNEQEYFRVNSEFTRNLAEAALTASIPLTKFVFISSLAALGPTHYLDPNPIQEKKEAMPVTAYGRSKLRAERYLEDMKDFPFLVMRPTAIYGPREKDILMFFKSLNKGFDPYISKKMQRLSFIHVKDVANMTIKAMASKKEKISYNLSDGNSYNRYALADTTKKILGKKAFRVHVPGELIKMLANILEMTSGNKVPALNVEKLKELTAENWNCSIEKIKSELGFVPEYDLEKGLSQTLKWYKEENWL